MTQSNTNVKTFLCRLCGPYGNKKHFCSSCIGDHTPFCTGSDHLTKFIINLRWSICWKHNDEGLPWVFEKGKIDDELDSEPESPPTI